MADFPAQLFRMEGDPGAVRASASKWSTFGTAAADASTQITKIDTGEFIGPEGELFRHGLNKDMPRHLQITGDAFNKVAGALSTFASSLESLRDQMRPVAQRAPGLWAAVQAAQGRLDRADSADRAHQRQLASQAPPPAGQQAPPDTYHSDASAASAALGTAQRQWQDCMDEANRLRGQLSTAVHTAVRAIVEAKGTRFKENPKWWDLGGQFTNFVRDNKDALKKLSGALKIVSLVSGLLALIPVLAPVMGPLSIGTGLLAGAIDLSVYAATGEGDLTGILVDIGFNLLPGVGKLARLGAGALRGTKVALAFSSVANRGRNMMSVAKWGLSDIRGNGIEALKRLVRLDPIDIASGAMVLTQTDANLPGLLPLVLSRTHLSSYRMGSWFGRSWASTLDQRIEIDEQGVYFATEDGMTLVYPLSSGGSGSVEPVEGPRWPLHRVADTEHVGDTEHVADTEHMVTEYTVTDPWRGWTWHFTPPARPVAVVEGRPAPPTQWPLTAISDRNGHRIELVRDPDGTPVEVRHSGGYRVRVHTDTNRVVALGLLDGDDGETTLLRFGYNDFGDLTEVVNSSGLPQRFEYDIEGRITAWIDRNGTTYHYTGCGSPGVSGCFRWG